MLIYEYDARVNYHGKHAITKERIFGISISCLSDFGNTKAFIHEDFVIELKEYVGRSSILDVVIYILIND